MPKPALMKDSIYRLKAIKWILALARMDGAWIAAYSLQITQITTQNKYYARNDKSEDLYPWWRHRRLCLCLFFMDSCTFTL